MTAATGGAIAGAAGLSMSTVAGGAVAGASGAVFGSPLQGIGNAAYFGDAYGGGQFLTDVLAGGILGGIAGGVAGWLKNVKNVRNGGQPGDIWGFKSAGSKGASVSFDAPEPTGAWGPDGKPLDQFAGYKFGGMEYLDEGVRSTPQPFAGANPGMLSFNKGVLESFSKHAFAGGRHADLGLPVETMASKGYNLIGQNTALLKAGDNTLVGTINGIQKSFKAFVQNGKIMSINMYPGVSNRATTGTVINLGNIKW